MNCYLAHSGYFKCCDFFVDIEIAPLNDKDVSCSQHICHPLCLNLDFFLRCLLDDNEPKREVASKVGDHAAIAFALKLSEQHVLLHSEEHPEAGKVSFESGEVLLVDGRQG